MRKANNKITTSKYNKYTFLPLNAYHQFRKPSNMFFLLTLVLLCIPQISPFNPYTYLFAFCLVTGTSIVKDGIEDYRKHKQDEKINHKKAYIVDENYVTIEINVESLEVGDFVIVQENEDIPADMIMLRSKMQTKKGVVCRDFCYVDSSNLDGESNLKKKTSHNDVECGHEEENNEIKDDGENRVGRSHKQHENNDNFEQHKGSNNHEQHKGSNDPHLNDNAPLNPNLINNTPLSNNTPFSNNTPLNNTHPNFRNFLCNCDKYFIGNIHNPSVMDTGDIFSKFDCKLQLHKDWILCNEKNVLLKGMKLKNTKSILAYVVAVGQNTKMGRCNITTRKGHSLFEGEVSKLVYVMFALYFTLLFISSLLGSLFLRKDNIDYLYLDDFLSKDALKQTGTNYIMFSYLIPLSLFVTLEVSRMFHAAYVRNDKDLEINDTKSICRNSSVTEDLGMVEYVLCDKTGTLTKNNMIFKYVHLKGSEELEGQYDCFRGDSLGLSRVNSIVGRDNNSKSIVGRDNSKSIVGRDNSKSIVGNDNSKSIVGNDNYSDRNDENNEINFMDSSSTISHKFMFILTLISCNGVDFLNNKYEGISQDEISILEGFRMNRILLLERTESHILIEIYGEVILININLTLDFTSSRQRMSILIKWNERHFLLTKGSDAKLIGGNIINISEEEKRRLIRLIEKNSKYRTLVVGYKEMNEEEVNEFILNFNSISLENIYQQEENIFERYEKGLKYLGTTFIEDELQDEVVETLSALKQANIKIWMITGDKKETAMSCAIDCGIMENVEDQEVLLVGGNEFDKVFGNNDGRRDRERGVGRDREREGVYNPGPTNLGPNRGPIQDNPTNNTTPGSTQDNPTNNTTPGSTQDNPTNNTTPGPNRLPINSTTPGSTQDNPTNNTTSGPNRLLLYKSVVIYRSTPHMKGKIALKFRDLKRNTLAVGDGNNDVGMLQTANIGVGILGKEGNQAGISGDFAIPGFSCLKKLILVHGRYNFIRFSKVTLNAFQKNIYFITIQFLYNFYNGFSGRPVYNSYFLNYYNVFFTSLIPATIALFDKNIPEENVLKNPGEYMKVRTYFSKQVLIFSTFYSIFEGIVIFFLVTGVFFKNDLISTKGKVGGYPALQNLFSLIVFTSVLLEQINLVSFMTYYTIWAIGLSIGLCFISLFLLDNTMWNLMSIPSFYFLFMMLILVSYILGLIQGRIIKVIRGV